MAPTRRGRKPALPWKFLEDRDWRLEVKERERGRKDKYWKNLETGKICRSIKEVKDILEADGICYTEPPTQAKGASCKTTVAKPTATSPASKELNQEIPKDVAIDVVPEQNAVVPPGDIIDNNAHGDGGLAVAPPGDIVDNNAHRDGGQEEVAQEQQHHGRMRSFDLKFGLPGCWE
uniref:MBD domain-containing protein n=1 Tax=Setaria viridis TaxID=4556 RepID=A0A4U6V9W7_SETVI|nr:hypothetical protein SEVIR_3G057400v2 [Setaria viridis]